MLGFGSGVVWGTPLTDFAGNAIAVPTPTPLGTLQDISFDSSFDIKMLHGQGAFPVDVARGKGKLSLKAKMGSFNAQMINGLVFGQTISTTQGAYVSDITGAAIPSTPFQLTPTVPNSGTWSRDLGVTDANAVPLIRVASAPATGQYSVTAGVYTFAAADTGRVVFINFAFTATSTTSKRISVLNVPMGTAPTFRCDLVNAKNNKQLGLSLYSCVSSKFTFGTKIDDYLIPEIDFEGFADNLGRVFDMFTAE